MKIPGLTTIGRLFSKLNPVPLVEDTMQTLFRSLFQKFLTSALKSFLTVVIAALTSLTIWPPPTDQGGMYLWAAFLVAVRALLSVLGKVVKQMIPEPPTTEVKK